MTESRTAVSRRDRPAGRVALLWEKGWIGAPAAGAAWTRCLIVLVLTLAGIAGSALLWSWSSYAGPLAIVDLLPSVLSGSFCMALLLYWQHAGVGQCMLYMLAYLTAALVGGAAVSGLVFEVRGVAARGTVTSCVAQNDVRTQWLECHVRLDGGRELPQPIRAEPGERHTGERVTVTYDRDGSAAPVFGDRTGHGAVLPGMAGGALAATELLVIGGTWTGERLRVRGKPSDAQGPNPLWYRRRINSPGYGSRAA